MWEERGARPGEQGERRLSRVGDRRGDGEFAGAPSHRRWFLLGLLVLISGCDSSVDDDRPEETDVAEDSAPSSSLAGDVFYTALADLAEGPQTTWIVGRPGLIASGDVVEVETSGGGVVSGLVWQDAFVAEVNVGLGDAVEVRVNGVVTGEVVIDEVPPRDGLPATVGTEQRLTHPDAEPVPDADGFYTYPIDMADIGWPVPALVFNVQAGRVVWVAEDGPDYTLAGRDRELFCIGSVRGEAAALTAAMCSRVVIAPL